MTTLKTAKKLPLWSAVLLSAIEAKFEADGRINNDTVKEMLAADESIFLAAGKTVNMLRSKIVDLGYYEKAAAKPKIAGKVATRKIEYVEAIQTLTGCTDLSSLEKASKPQLEMLAGALTTLSDNFNADNEE
jgi:hypothetical protein